MAADEIGDDLIVNVENADVHRQMLNAALAKRLSRNERLDNRRYHTAGAIEDIKVSSTTHHRRSWNDFILYSIFLLLFFRNMIAGITAF